MFKVDADTYDRFVGRYTPALARAMIELVGVSEGQRVLDVGCGPGALTHELAAVVGPDLVAAVDPSEAFVEACRERNPGVDVRVAGAESIPFEDATFDVSIAQLVVNFMNDAHAGVNEMRRVTRPQGKVAAAVWDYGGEMTMLRTFWDAAAHLAPRGGARDERNMRFATQAELRDLWTAVGLQGVETTAAVVSAAYEGFDDLWAPFEAGVGPAGSYTTSLPASDRAKLKQELQSRLGVGSAPFELSARAWVVTGRVGSG